jgi:hypothetical protein
MENEMEMGAVGALDQLATRLAAVVEVLEQTASRGNAGVSDAVGPIVAMVEGSREVELSRRLAEAEKTIVELRAAASAHEGRKTLPANLLAKQEGSGADSGLLDAALRSLSLEQRIAVKSQLLRAGLV